MQNIRSRATINMVSSSLTLPSSISLTPKEEELFSILLETCAWIQREQMNTLIEANLVHGTPESVAQGPTLRIAGGWVRDKLLGLDSDDIDVTIDIMKGEAFALQLQEYLAHHATPSGKEGASVMKTVATISGNPEKSKHLETATAQVLGLELDFVNLRTEEYTNSRTPSTISFGTPLEDSLRRDITINALFYNIHSRQIEDWTKMGLDDLNLGMIRTPLDPDQTFSDDPLRILRCLRFATRFGYVLHPSIIAAAKQPHIKEAFSAKISRERVGIEVAKMLKGPQAARSVHLIHDFGYEDAVFAFPTTAAVDATAPTPSSSSSITVRRREEPIPPENDGYASLLHSYTGGPALRIQQYHKAFHYPNWVELDIVPIVEHGQALVDKQVFLPFHTPSGSHGPVSSSRPSTPVTWHLDSNSKKNLYLACALLKAHAYVYEEKKKVFPVPRYITLTSLKLSLKEAEAACSILEHVTAVRHMISYFPTSDLNRGQLGRFIRAIASQLKDQFILVFYLALAMDYCEWGSEMGRQLEHTYVAFLARIQHLDLLRAYEIRPLLDGKSISRILAIPPGKQIKEALDAVLDQQLLYPEISVAEMEEWIRTEFTKDKKP